LAASSIGKNQFIQGALNQRTITEEKQEEEFKNE
jgi:hypothetical protein